MILFQLSHIGLYLFIFYFPLCLFIYASIYQHHAKLVHSLKLMVLNITGPIYVKMDAEEAGRDSSLSHLLWQDGRYS